MSNWKVDYFNNEKIDCKLAHNVVSHDIELEGKIAGASNTLLKIVTVEFKI